MLAFARSNEFRIHRAESWCRGLFLRSLSSSNRVALLRPHVLINNPQAHLGGDLNPSQGYSSVYLTYL